MIDVSLRNSVPRFDSAGRLIRGQEVKRGIVSLEDVPTVGFPHVFSEFVMRKGALLAFALSAALIVSITASAQPPGGDKGPGGKGGPGGRGGFGMRPQPGQIMPPFLADRLKLTDDQKKAIADLQKDVDTKLDKMLTDEQKAELKKMKEAGPGGFGGGPGGPGGGPGGPGGGPGGPGGKGGEKGPPRGEKKE